MTAALKPCFAVPAVLEDSCLQIAEGVLPTRNFAHDSMQNHLLAGVGPTWKSIYGMGCSATLEALYLYKIEFSHSPKSQYWNYSMELQWMERKGSKSATQIFCYIARSGEQGMKLRGSASCSQAANTLTNNLYFELDSFSRCPCIPNFTNGQAW